MKKDLEIGSSEEIGLNERFEVLRLEPSETYTLPKIAKKLETGKQLEKLEIIMAAATIRDWLRLKQSQTGRPPIYKTEAARRTARTAQNNAANVKRRKKEKPPV